VVYSVTVLWLSAAEEDNMEKKMIGRGIARIVERSGLYRILM
jgi:hypothetical protein